jgi:hypothetical protein
MGGDHTLLLRARDEDGNTSEEARGSISLPPSPSCPEKNGGPYYAIDCIKIADGLIKIRFRLLQSPGSIVFGIIPYLADKNPQASQALHKNINGNAAYPETTANGGVGFCNANITPIEQYELGRQYQRNFSSISGVSAQDIAPTSTLKFAIFQGTVCSINDAIFWNDPQEYKID